MFPYNQGRVQSGRVRADPIPRIRPAGQPPFGTEDSVDHCVRAEVYAATEQKERPSTPEYMKKYRKSFTGAPGMRQVHFGLRDDLEPIDYQHAYGRQTGHSDKVDTVIKAQNMNGLVDKFNDMKEAKYASHAREPLGRGYERGYDMPSVTQTDGFKFGVPSGQCISAKDLLYPAGGAMEERPATAKMYEYSHGHYAAGQQRKRDYQWTVDPQEHCFGYSEQKLLNGVARSVHQERYDEAFPKTVIVKKDVEDMRAVAQDQIAQSKNLGQGSHPVPQDFAFGTRNNFYGQWNAAKCIQGEPSERELQPDADLGTCTKLGARNMVRSDADRDRHFGCPTIRTDIPKKKMKSVADYQNYGDEPEAVDVLFPATNTDIGISEEDFKLPRSRANIKQLFANIGYSYRPGKFNAIYNRALEFMPVGAPHDMVSCRAFMTAISMLHDVQ